MKQPRAFHPLAIALFPVLSLYSANVAEIPWSDVLRPAAVALGSVLLLWGLLRGGLRHGPRAALACSLLVAAFWLSHYLLLGLQALTGPLGNRAYHGLLVLWTGAVLYAAIRIGRSASDFGVATRALNLAGAVLLASALASAAGQLGAGASPGARPGGARLPGVEGLGLGEAPEPLPDIFWIVLDAYGGDELLRERFAMPEGLAELLEERGFYVARQSRCNYNQTLPSLRSMLNFEYLRDDAKHTIWPCLSRARRVASELGYRFVSCATGFVWSECRRADLYLHPAGRVAALGGLEFDLSNFETTLLNASPVERVLRSSGELSPYDRHRRRILGCLDALPALADNGVPDFVLAHLVTPHEPFVFGRHGEDVSPYDRRYALNEVYDDPDLPDAAGQVGPEYARRYRDQALFISGRVAEVVDAILARSETPPIILANGDHGPYGFSPNVHEARFPILNAYLLPGGGEVRLYPEISPVNSFRVVLQHYFGAELPLLPDRSFRTEGSGWLAVE